MTAHMRHVTYIQCPCLAFFRVAAIARPLRLGGGGGVADGARITECSELDSKVVDGDGRCFSGSGLALKVTG